MPKKNQPKKKIPKWVIWSVIALVIIVAYYLWKKRQANNDASIGPTDPNQGLASAYIGGVPNDNSFATTTDLLGVQSQLSQMQLSMLQLNAQQPAPVVSGPAPPHRRKRDMMPIETTTHTGNTLPVVITSH